MVVKVWGLHVEGLGGVGGDGGAACGVRARAPYSYTGGCTGRRSLLPVHSSSAY